MMSTLSVSQRLHEALGKIIQETPPGQRLLSEPELAMQLGVSRATLREGMRTFETQGLIRRRQGSGTYVSHPSMVIESGLEVLESIDTLAERIGLDVSLGELRVKQTLPDEEERQALNIPAGCEVLRVSRVILAENRPVAYLIDTLPCGALPVSEFGEGFTGSVFDLLMQPDKPKLHSSRTEINAVTASPEIARLMGIQRGDVLLRFVAYLYTNSGEVIDYSYSYFLPGYFRFHVVRRVG